MVFVQKILQCISSLQRPGTWGLTPFQTGVANEFTATSQHPDLPLEMRQDFPDYS